jgi:protein involved in polysaccharide export with SLBB domain
MMRGVRKVRWLTVVAILLGAMAVTALTRAQTTPESTPQLTEEQLQILQDLPEEERQALIEQYLKSREQGAESPTAGERGTTTPSGRSTTSGKMRPLSPESQGTVGTLSADEQLRRLKALQELKEPPLKENDSLIIDLKLRQREDRPARLTDRLEALRDRILERNPYRLDRYGQLSLPGFEPMTMLGLTEKLAALRLGADKDLVEFTVKVTRLDIKAAGDEALKPFGYDLFTDVTSSFAPATDVPVPSDYILGPGDQLRVQLFGNTNRVQTFTVGRDGQISFPQIGPITVGGQRFSAVKASIEDHVARQMIGVRAYVQMGETRGVRIFLLGEVEKPGSYTVSGLSTVTNALFAGGGIKRSGSLRNIQLKRSGQLVRRLDLYDLLLRGDTNNDVRLLAGDVVFIPPIGNTVSVNGEVLRPAIYEIRDEVSVGDLVNLSGGLTPEADQRQARLERRNEKGERAVTNIDLSSASARSETLQNGDFLRVLRIRDVLDGGVTVSGFVYQSQPFEYRSGLRLSDVLRFEDLKPGADTHYVLIRRELPPDRKASVVSADLAAALAAPGSEKDILLQPRDQLTVFDLQSGRDRVVSNVLDDLRAQATYSQPLQAVIIGGRVRAPGQYPLEPNMRVSDLIRAGGSLEDAAYGGKAELSRYEAVNGEYRQTELIDIDLAAVLRGDAAANIVLKPYDALNIKELPQWRELEIVTIEGEVRFPGVYPIQRGETMRSVLQRAGGLSDLAFSKGAVFTREELRKREQEQLDRLTERLKRDLAVLALQGAQSGVPGTQALVVGQGLLEQLKGSSAVGRLVIDLDKILAGNVGGSDDIALKNGDRLLVPKQSQEVSVIGEVQNATSHRYAANLTREDYIGLSGGYAKQADESRVYVVRANGSVVANSGNRWFTRSGSEGIEPGDTVVVPLDAGKMRPLPLWTAVTTIIYNLAVAVAAVNSF